MKTVTTKNGITILALGALLGSACGGGGAKADAATGGAGGHGGAAGAGGAGGTGGADSGATDGAITDGAVDSGFPAPPALGAQIDRMGRAAVNTALNHTFDTDMTAKNAAKDAYNAALQATWPTFTNEIAKNLAILDGLDMNCHNQFLHMASNDGATRYQPLAMTLADDQLYVDTSTGTCMQYLGVELKATGAAPTLVDCGGRTPLEDAIDVTLSALVLGATTGVNDGVNADDQTPSATTFPFLVAPQ
jgi:hypothetical protein